jgi:hypothetical protein
MKSSQVVPPVAAKKGLQNTDGANCRTTFVRVPINSTSSVEGMMDTIWTIGCRLRLSYPKSRRRPK